MRSHLKPSVNKNFLRLLFTCIASLVMAGAAFAHHSGAAYDFSQLVVIEGTVTSLTWKNPHVIMTVGTTGADGALLEREIEVMSVSQGRGLGLRREAISPGEPVVVRAAPGRGGSRRAFGIQVTTRDGSVMPLSSFARFSAMQPPLEAASGLAGTWAPSVDSFVSVAAAGRTAQVTEAGARAREQALLQYAAADGSGVGICEPLTPPLLHIFPDLRIIEVTDETIVIRSETNGVQQTRVIHLDLDTHPSGIEPTTEGHSIGHWEGATLVIDTVGFAPARTPDLTLLPSHPSTHLVEKLTLTLDQRQLVYEFALDNPAWLIGSANFRATWDYRGDLELSGVACDPESARQLLQAE